MEVRLKMRGLSALLSLVLGVVGGAGSFVVVTVLANRIPDLVVVAACAVGAVASLLLVAQRDHAFRVRDVRFSHDWLALLGGVASFWAAPLLALSQRLTDAPTGTETAFFTTAAWGFVTALAATLVRHRRVEGSGGGPRNVSAIVLAGALSSVVGSAVLLASWERPSSFSPFVRFAQQEIVMVVAGAIFVGGLLALERYALRHGWVRAAYIAAFGAGALGLVAAIPSVLGEVAMVSHYGRALVALVLFSAMLVGGVLRLSREHEVGRSAAVWLLIPSVLTALSLLERLTGVRGPDPVRWGSAGAGIAVALAGALALWFGFSESRAFPVEDSPKGRRGFAFAAIIVAASSVLALAVPTIQGEVTASLGEPFHIRWDMYGFETAAGLVATAALLLAASALFLSRLGFTKSIASAALAVFVSAAAYPLVLDTPLRTWTSWVPGDIQQVYGTDYARLTFVPVDAPIVVALLVLAVATAIVSLVIAMRRSRVSRMGLEG